MINFLFPINTSKYSTDNNRISFGATKELKTAIKIARKTPNIKRLDEDVVHQLLSGTVFEKLPKKEFLRFIQNNDNLVIRLKSGCENVCGHCMLNANNSDNKIMNWDNFKSFAYGIRKIIKRLGHSPLDENSFFNQNGVIPFFDSDPIQIRINDMSISTLAKFFQQKTGLKFFITTAGWNPTDKLSQQAGNELVENVKKNNELFEGQIAISINPFHKDMMQSINYEKNINYKNFIHNYLKSQEFRENYVNRMVGTIKTFLPIFKQQQTAVINFVYAPNLEKNRGYGFDESKKLLTEICKRVYEECEQESNPYLEQAKSLYEDTQFDLSYTRTISAHEIVPQGRAENFFETNHDRNVAIYGNNNIYKIIDTDGKLLMFHAASGKYIDTGLQLDFKH